MTRNRGVLGVHAVPFCTSNSSTFPSCGAATVMSDIIKYGTLVD